MTDKNTSLPRLTPQVVIGLLIAFFGLAVTADNLNWIAADRVWDLWPLILVAFGVAKLLQVGNRSGQVFGAILMLIGGSIAVERFFDVNIDIWNFFPLVFVFAGGMIVYRAWWRPRQPDVLTSAAGQALTDSSISEFAFWAGIKRRIMSPAFKRADLTAIMGGIELDLRQAGTAGGEAVIDVFVMWGGIEITVPPDWAVSNRVVPIMGGADDKSSGTQDSRHRLVLRGFVVMGGVEIKT